MSNSVDPDKTLMMSRLVWIYAVCKILLLSPVAVKELNLFAKSINQDEVGHNELSHSHLLFVFSFPNFVASMYVILFISRF